MARPGLGPGGKKPHFPADKTRFDAYESSQVRLARTLAIG